MKLLLFILIYLDEATLLQLLKLLAFWLVPRLVDLTEKLHVGTVLE